MSVSKRKPQSTISASSVLACAVVATFAATGSVQAVPITLGEAANYVIFQTGNSNDGELNITSSTLTGDLAKAVDGGNKELKISSSTINGDWWELKSMQ